MLVLLSPSKTMVFEEAPERRDISEPVFEELAARLMDRLRPMSASKLAQLMGINEQLASLTAARFAIWQQQHSSERVVKAAAHCFKGAVYTGLNASAWSDDDFDFAQRHVRILSGLYGILRPKDGIQPYRLEMGLKWSPNPDCKDLYAFWSHRIQAAIAQESSGLIINLASKEYSQSALPKAFAGRIITPSFKERVGDTFKAKMAYGKEARGTMAQFIVRERLTEAEALKSFRGMGYAFNPELSSGDDWTFTRNTPTN